jgi:predicted nucleotidyltransferase
MQTLLPPLPETVQLTLANCKQQLQQHYGCKLKALILYGSAANQRLTPQSDLDLLVLLDPPLDYFQELRAIVDLLYPLQLDASHWISAKPAAIDEFEQGLTQLYRNIHQEGIVV